MKSILKSAFIIGLTLFSLTSSAQQKMQSLEQLINTTDPAWPLVQKWLDSAKNKVQVLECDSVLAKTALYQAQVSTYATLGAVIYHTGGIMIDNGWLRILGSGSAKLSRSVPEWNKGKSIKEYGEKPDFTLVADDAIGGFFAINYGAFGSDIKSVYYLAPNSLKWESLGLGYTEFLRFCLDGDLSDFYKGLRWSTWDQFIANLDGNKSYSFRPYLWTEAGMDIEKVSRKLVPTEDLYRFNITKQKEVNPAGVIEKH
ncbi:DUF2625 domain-containing protein [Pedobacter gandavensis]|uniref:DUF2625 domain-containing protein n=1 Tax=Pedobacter TaxID=84567 RepID=UPI001C98F0D8|nr:MULTISPECIES: DUF2625 domain-containing protein [Pedobacter]WGQ11851.1 DUF2625 domain-containing protein [Pedobacter gandavensis]